MVSNVVGLVLMAVIIASTLASDGERERDDGFNRQPFRGGFGGSPFIQPRPFGGFNQGFFGGAGGFLGGRPGFGFGGRPRPGFGFGGRPRPGFGFGGRPRPGFGFGGRPGFGFGGIPFLGGSPFLGGNQFLGRGRGGGDTRRK